MSCTIAGRSSGLAVRIILPGYGLGYIGPMEIDQACALFDELYRGINPYSVRVPARYEVPGDAVLKVYEEGESLLVCCTRMQAWPVELQRVGSDLFEMSGFPIGIHFRRAQGGAIDGIDIKVNSQMIFAKRLP